MDGFVMVVTEPVVTLKAGEAPRDEHAEKEQKADDEAAEARRKREDEDEARRKKEAAEAAEAAAREVAAKEAAKAAAPEEPAADDVDLPLTFRDASGTKTYTVSFKTKPLGLDFNHNSNPVKVKKAFGAAKTLGVSEGSDLINVDGTDVEKLDFGEMLEVLKERIAPLTPDGLVMNFRDQSGQQRSIVFPTKPLGMDFDHRSPPIRIKNVHGAAQRLGVEAGWELLTITGTDVERLDFDKMLGLLRAKIVDLPTKDVDLLMNVDLLTKVTDLPSEDLGLTDIDLQTRD